MIGTAATAGTTGTAATAGTIGTAATAGTIGTAATAAMTVAGAPPIMTGTVARSGDAVATTGEVGHATIGVARRRNDAVGRA
jgi:hypothetical protein